MSTLYYRTFEKQGHTLYVFEQYAGSNLYIGQKDGRKWVFRRSLKTKDRKKAAKLAQRALDAAIAKEKDFQQHDDDLTLGVLVARHLESEEFKDMDPKQAKRRRNTLRRFERYFGAEFPVMKLNLKRLLQYRTARVEGTDGLRAVKPLTAYHDYANLRATVNWALQEEDSAGNRLLSSYPFDGIRFPKGKNKNQPVVSDREHEAILRTCRNRQWWERRMFILMADGTGRRSNSIRLLEWESVDLEDGLIRWDPEADKMGHADVTPIPDDLWEELRAWRHTHPDARWVIENPETGKPYVKSTVEKWPKFIWNAAGLERDYGLGWHGYRRKVATRMALAGIDEEYIMAYTGHRSLEALREYIQLARPETVRDKLREMGFGGHRRGHRLDSNDLERKRKSLRRKA